ncbi:MAG: septum formation inhibitor Maf [Bdellovibrionales bacterium]|nr:septum formation inhibitor Maf [Bdellovibrionales bacterium]
MFSISSTTPLVLASASPRRKELLEALGISLAVCPSSFDEEWNEGELPVDGVVRFARCKALDVATRNPSSVVLGADTIVVVDGVILEKPKDKEDALRMLQMLSGRTHSVFGGVAILGIKRGLDRTFLSETKVTFSSVPENLLRHYVASGEPLDKAGAYGIQGLAQVFVESVQGSYSNVVGLDTAKTVELLMSEDIISL